MKIIALLILLAIGIGLGYLIHLDPGYVWIHYHDWTITTSLWFAVACIMALLIVLYTASRVFARSRELGGWLSGWRGKKKRARAMQLTREAITFELLEEWEKGEKSYIKAAELFRNPLTLWCHAARMASRRDDFEAMDRHLDAALANHPKEAFTVELCRATYLYQARQNNKAARLFTKLHNSYQKNGLILKRLIECEISLTNVKHLEQLLPSIENSTLQTRAFIAINQCTTLNMQRLDALWDSCNKNTKRTADAVAMYASKLNQWHETKPRARKALQKQLKHGLSTTFLETFAKQSDDLVGDIDALQKLLSHQEKNVDLLFALAQLCFRAKVYGQAKKYAEQALAIEARPEIKLLLTDIEKT